MISDHEDSEAIKFVNFVLVKARIIVRLLAELS